MKCGDGWLVGSIRTRSCGFACASSIMASLRKKLGHYEAGYSRFCFKCGLNFCVLNTRAIRVHFGLVTDDSRDNIRVFSQR